MDTNLLWENNCGSPLHLVLIQESVIHSLDRPHLLWPRRQTCTLTLPRASDLQAWQRFWTRSSTPTQPARPVDPITHSTSPHLMARHGTPHSTSQHLTAPTAPTAHFTYQYAKCKQSSKHLPDTGPLSATNAYRPRSEPHAQLPTLRGCNTCRWCLFTPLSTLMNVWCSDTLIHWQSWTYSLQNALHSIGSTQRDRSTVVSTRGRRASIMQTLQLAHLLMQGSDSKLIFR